MDGAKILLVEDSEKIRRAMNQSLERAKHSVVSMAGSIAEAGEVIDGLEPGAINVALVDGNYSRRLDSAEGTIVAAMLRAKFGDTVSIIGMTDSPHGIEGADRNITKLPSAVLGAIAEL